LANAVRSSKPANTTVMAAGALFRTPEKERAEQDDDNAHDAHFASSIRVL